ncbi:hypothetical protein FXO38_00729 [Capsicum annuum]|nr:hypothetical protein FXO38_00729 [Capsicum annuum]
MLLLEVRCNKKNLLAFYVYGSYIEFTLGLVTGLSTKSLINVLSSIWEKRGGSRLLNTYFDGADKLKIEDLKNFMKTRKGAVEAFSLEHELQKLQSICLKKLKKILDENNFLKSELSQIKTLLLGKLKADGDILYDKQHNNLQGKRSHDPTVDDQSDDPYRPTSLDVINYVLLVGVLNMMLNSVQSQGHTNHVVLDSDASLLLPFYGYDKLFFDIYGSTFVVIILEIAWFGGMEVDGDNIDGTKNWGDVDSIINNVISSVFATSSSLPTSLNVKNTQAERSVKHVDSISCLAVYNGYIYYGSWDTLCDNIQQETGHDCGEFVCAFNEYVIHGRDIPKEINIGYVCMRYGALLWDYGKRKLQAGIKDNITKKVGRFFGKEKRKRTYHEE